MSHKKLEVGKIQQQRFFEVGEWEWISSVLCSEKTENWTCILLKIYAYAQTHSILSSVQGANALKKSWTKVSPYRRMQKFIFPQKQCSMVGGSEKDVWYRVTVSAFSGRRNPAAFLCFKKRHTILRRHLQVKNIFKGTKVRSGKKWMQTA